jgi:hypothetical protein
MTAGATCLNKRRAQWLAVWALTFALILIARWSILSSPPYVEQAYGLWTEAAYLAQHDFDYRALANDLHGDKGGPRAYLTTILPGVVGILQQYAASTTAAIVLYRLFVFGCAAVVLTAVWIMARDQLSPWLATLICLATALTPLFSVQIDMIGLDMPALACVAIGVLLATRERYGAAAVCTVAAFFLKNSAFLLSLAVGWYLLLLLVWGLVLPADRRRRVARAAAIHLALAACLMSVVVLGGNASTRMHWPREGDLRLWLCSAPDWLALLVFAVAATLLALANDYSAAVGAAANFSQRLKLVFQRWSEKAPVLGLGWLMIAINTALVLPVFFECRYLTITVPLLFLVAATSLQQAGYRRLWVVPVIAIAWGIANYDGRLLPRLNVQSARGVGVLERSREYLVDHQSNMAAARAIERTAPHMAILSAEQFNHYLVLPELGLVSRSLLAGSSDFHFAADDANLERIVLDQPSELLVVRVHSQLGERRFPAFNLDLPTASDTVVYDDALRPPVVVFIRRFPATGASAERTTAYLNLLFADADWIDPLARLAVLGWRDAARACVSDKLGHVATNEEVAEAMIESLNRLWNDVHMCGAARHRAAPGLIQTVEARLAELKDPARGLARMDYLSVAEKGLPPETPQRVLYIAREDRQ